MAQLNQSPASELHLDRYYRNKSGESIQEIAAKDGVDEVTVKSSIRSIELYRQRHDVQVLNESVVGAVMDVIPEVGRSLTRQLRAKNGKRQDYEVQRGAIAEIRGLIQTVQPKAPSVHATQVNVGKQDGGTVRLATGSYIGMEDRLKKITQELESNQGSDNRKQLSQAPLQTIDEAEYEEIENPDSAPEGSEPTDE